MRRSSGTHPRRPSSVRLSSAAATASPARAHGKAHAGRGLSRNADAVTEVFGRRSRSIQAGHTNTEIVSWTLTLAQAAGPQPLAPGEPRGICTGGSAPDGTSVQLGSGGSASEPSNPARAWQPHGSPTRSTGTVNVWDETNVRTPSTDTPVGAAGMLDRTCLALSPALLDPGVGPREVLLPTGQVSETGGNSSPGRFLLGPTRHGRTPRPVCYDSIPLQHRTPFEQTQTVPVRCSGVAWPPRLRRG